MGLERNITVDGKWEAMSTTSTTHGRSFPGLSIATINIGVMRIKQPKQNTRCYPNIRTLQDYDNGVSQLE
jgi:hypothetical protein